MHIPDGILATPVWLGLDLAAVPAIGWIARKARAELDPVKIPLLGVMGAFVFAAQLINFPVGPGTSGHLLGGALLAYTLGPASASLVMTAILAIQALVFQDGGVLALGPNVVNMALVGVWVSSAIFRAWGGTRTAAFSGAALSVIASAVLAVVELLASGVSIPGPVLGLSMSLFVLSGLIEGAITLVALESIERLRPGAVRRTAPSGRIITAIAVASLLIACIGVLFASSLPDGFESLAEKTGVASHGKLMFETAFSDYEWKSVDSPWLKKAGAGIAGLAVVYLLCAALARLIRGSNGGARTAEPGA